MLLPQFAIIPLAVVLVWLGLSRGLRRSTGCNESCADADHPIFSPISTVGVPEEVRPADRRFLGKMMGRLEENLQAQQRFIADAAHQMRTPLTGLRTQTELALQETEPRQLRRSSLEQIAGSAERASHLINQLLSLARAESSSEKIYAVEQLDLNDLATDVVQIFPAGAGQAHDLWPSRAAGP